MSRREQARQTRVRILEAAYDLFCTAGYEETTMQLVAEAAGVAEQTVYFTFGTKRKLLAEVADRAISGDTPPHRWRELSWGRRILEAEDAGQLLQYFVEGDTEIKLRLSPLLAAVGGALFDGPESRVGRDQGQDEFFGALVQRLAALSMLKEGLSRDRALDIVSAINSVETFTELVLRRGWTREEWRAWLIDLLWQQLVNTKAQQEARSGPLPDPPISPGDE